MLKVDPILPLLWRKKITYYHRICGGHWRIFGRIFIIRYTKCKDDVWLCCNQMSASYVYFSQGLFTLRVCLWGFMVSCIWLYNFHQAQKYNNRKRRLSMSTTLTNCVAVAYWYLALTMACVSGDGSYRSLLLNKFTIFIESLVKPIIQNKNLNH